LGEFLKAEVDALKWMVGFNLVMTVGILWMLLRVASKTGALG
jgi:hypothetical protein